MDSARDSQEYDLLDDAGDLGRANNALFSDDEEPSDADTTSEQPAAKEPLLNTPGDSESHAMNPIKNPPAKTPIRKAKRRHRRRQQQAPPGPFYRELRLRNAASLCFIFVGLVFTAYYFIPTFFGLSGNDNGHDAQESTTSSSESSANSAAGSLNNQTHRWERTVILVSLDGVRADYLERGLTPNLLSISKRGLRAKYMKPVFPSLTFVNHWSILTGLYAESHGIVANDFWDPIQEKEFNYQDPKRSWDAAWWGGEPFWATAARAGIKTANIMWPGPPELIDGTRPTYFAPFEDHYHWSKKTDQIAKWLDLPFEERPRFITTYLPEVDQTSHSKGPESRGTDKTLRYVDDFAHSLYELIDKRQLNDIVDLIFVSDHGMTDTSNERIVYLDDALGDVGFDGIAHKEGWPSCGLRFKPHIDVKEMYERLQQKATQTNGGIQVYTHSTMPEKYHFSGHPRIAPIYVVPKVGWVISDKTEHLDLMKGDYKPKGNHGYDPDEPDMHAIFVAHGPFAEDLKLRRRRQGILDGTVPTQEDKTAVIDGFQNLEVYSLLGRLLDIPRDQLASHNGTEGFWDKWLG